MQSCECNPVRIAPLFHSSPYHRFILLGFAMALRRFQTEKVPTQLVRCRNFAAYGSVAFLVALPGCTVTTVVKSHLLHERTRFVAEHLRKRAWSIGIENLQLQMHLQGTYQVPNRADKIGSLFGNISEAHAGSCTRNCARMTTLLLAGRERGADLEKSRFSLVNRLFFETKGNVFKSMISQS